MDVPFINGKEWWLNYAQYRSGQVPGAHKVSAYVPEFFIRRICQRRRRRRLCMHLESLEYLEYLTSGT